MAKQVISTPVIRRLPRYYRFLGDLEREHVERISSRELAQRMGLSASQIRQDFNCFGGFGQQGYGYHVKELREIIGGILGVNQNTGVIMNTVKTITDESSGKSLKDLIEANQFATFVFAFTNEALADYLNLKVIKLKDGNLSIG